MDNTVGSLTQFQRSIIIGSILGDGYLRIVPGRSNAFLEINHGYSAKEYVDWKFKKLKNLCASEPKRYRGNGNRMAYRFWTRQHPELTELYRKFYRRRKKIIPDDLKLDPTILFVWFMDDGSRCRQYDVYLNTQQFSTKDQMKLINKLEQLNLEATLNRDKSYYRIRFLKSSVDCLNRFLKANIIPSMEYKIGL